MRISLAGLGLVGGSLALALRERHQVRGFDPDPATARAARQAGLATVAAVEALLPADVVIVATPLDAVVATLGGLAPAADGALLMDVGSLKRPVAEFARTAPPEARIVGGHPMAGSTARGFEAARADLFQGRPFLLVPTERSDSGAMALAGGVAREVGGVVTVCSAEVHDRAMAAVSALPLAVAAALALLGAESGVSLGAFAGPGFRDATRLALTSEELGATLLARNAENVRDAMAALRRLLDEIERAVASRDAASIRALLARAAEARRTLD